MGEAKTKVVDLICVMDNLDPKNEDLVWYLQHVFPQFDKAYILWSMDRKLKYWTEVTLTIYNKIVSMDPNLKKCFR